MSAGRAIAIGRLLYRSVHRAVSALLHEEHPWGMGLTIGVPEDQCDDAAARLIPALLRPEGVLSLSRPERPTGVCVVRDLVADRRAMRGDPTDDADGVDSIRSDALRGDRPISKDDLASRIAGQLRVASDLLPDVSRVAVAAGLHGITWTAEGDPGEVGRRTGGTIPGFGKSTDQALVEARDSVPRELVGPSANEIAAELAMRVLLRYREIMR